MLDLINLFVLTGGSGAGWSLVIAIMLFSKDLHSRHIAKISMPFAFFNINELLIFGLPIVFNPYLLIPFIFVPLFTFSCSLLAASIGIIEFVPHSLSWITPPIINSYIASNGDISTILFQCLMIFMGVVIYAPFVKISHLYNDDREVSENLARKLSLENIVNNETEPTPSEAPKEHSIDTNNIIDEIISGDLLLHYQPIINVNNRLIDKFSAQLLLQRSDRKIIPLDFLHQLHRESITNVIYNWMLSRVSDDMKEWKIKGFRPKISIPIERNTLKQNSIIDRIITEHSSIDNDLIIRLQHSSNTENILFDKNLTKLCEGAFEVTLADFGEDSININMLLRTEVDTIEFSQNYFHSASSRHASYLFEKLCSLCQKMGFKVHISGIDTLEQAQRAETYNIDSMQGHYYSPALSAKDAYRFCSEWNEKIGGSKK